MTVRPAAHRHIAAGVFLALCAAAQPQLLGEVVGKAHTRKDLDSFRVRRITFRLKGTWDHAELAMPPHVMLPLDVELQVRRKRYEVCRKPPKEYPVAGFIGVNYSVTRKAKAQKAKRGGTAAKFEVTLKGRISLETEGKNDVLWRVDSSTTVICDKSEKLSADTIKKLVDGFYKGVFNTLPEAPRFKMVVGAPYRFDGLLTREPIRPAHDTISAGRIMRETQKGRWEGAPAPLHYADGGGGDPVVQVWNDSDQQLTVCYEGVTDADIILSPNAKMAFRLGAGPYKVVAKTADDAIVPLHSTENLKANQSYSIRFAVSEEGY